MHAVLEIESLAQDWKPPFAKRRETRSVSVSEGEIVETLKDGSALFTIKSIQGDRILLAYSRLYTLKGYEHPTERQLWLGMHEAKKFSSLWEDNGITKTVTLRDVKMGDNSLVQQEEALLSNPPESNEFAPVVSNTGEKGFASMSNSDTEIYRPNQ